MTLYSWSSPNKDPGCPSSIRINILKPVPSIPLHAPVIKYKVPIFLWLQDQSCLERPVFRSSQIPPPQKKKMGSSGRLDPVLYKGGGMEYDIQNRAKNGDLDETGARIGRWPIV